MHEVVPIIILVIICIQVYFFCKNFIRMHQFGSIFSDTTSWRLRRNIETDFVDGVDGDGNSIFLAIVASINKYLGNNSGSVIDFSLLKDAVDRHSNSVEDDIATQTPIPLYWGLAGTMVGVIMGLGDLLRSDAIMTLMGSSGGVIDQASHNAATGVNSLLSGVAWAMLASICGILLTTANSLLFKRCKLKEEEGKNSFLAWMQSELLPELPSDTSDALNALVKNLNRFNVVFSENTSNLGNTLSAVNQSYEIQADIIRSIHDMDVMKMAQANVRVLEQLQLSTDKLEVFNDYLDDIKGYTEAIHRFESLFNEEANRIHILEEIRDYFARHKDEISKSTAEADDAIKTSLYEIKRATSDSVNELHLDFVKLSEDFKEILKVEKEAFEQFSMDLKIQFSEQMNQMPQLAKQLEQISSIPGYLDKLISKIEESNNHLANEIIRSVKQSLQSNTVYPNNYMGDIPTSDQKKALPNWMKFSGWVAIVLIAISCVLNVIFNLFPLHHEFPQTQTVYVQPTQVAPNLKDSVGTKASDANHKEVLTDSLNIKPVGK